MSPLSIAAREEVEAVRMKLKSYKINEKLTISKIAEECEVSVNLIRDFLNGHSPKADTFYKIKFALGF